MYALMSRELRWPIAIALIVGAVTMGPKLVGGAVDWVTGRLGDEQVSASAGESSGDEAAPTESMPKDDDQRRW